MKKIDMSIEIDAPRHKVWSVLWEDKSYRQWTSVFMEGSYARSDWQEGSRILFLGPDGSGMFSKIERMVPNSVMYFKHLGYVKDGVEQPETEESKKWSGSMENYTLNDKNGKTVLRVEQDIDEKYYDNFQSTFHKALQIVKELSEKR